MSTNSRRRMQFIHISNPTAKPSADAQRQAHSHAAREAHARVRRLRTMKHQSRNITQHVPACQGRDEDNHVINREAANNSYPAATWTNSEVEFGGVPTPVSLLASHRRDPFACFATSFKPVEHFLLDHYVKTVVPFMNHHCIIFATPHNPKQVVLEHWVRFCLADIGLISSILLAACRHLSSHHFQEHVFVQLGLQYKLTCLQSVNKAISKDILSVDKFTIGKVIALAMDEMMIGDLNASRHHVLGLVKMVEFNGGPQSLGEDEFLRLFIHIFLYNKGLFDAESGPPFSDGYSTLVNH